MRNLGTYILGDDIKYTITTESEASAAVISVKDGSGVEQITSQALTKDSTLVWSGVIQSTVSWTKGKCVFETTLTTGSYDNFEQGYFVLEDEY